MHVLVIGAGVVGASTALELARHGCQVTVVEGGSEPGLGASHANAGLLSPGHSFSWAAPGVLKDLFGIAMGRNDGLGIASRRDPALWRWGIRFLRECRHNRWHANSQAAIALAAYSRALMREQRVPPESSYSGARNGILYLYVDASRIAPEELALLDACKERYDRLEAGDLHDIEPLLSVGKQQFGAAVYCADDATGDARLFTTAAVDEARRLGAVFSFGEPVERLLARNGRIEEVRTRNRTLKTDAVVLTAGLQSANLARSLGYRLPIHPVTGYSITYTHPHDFGSQPRVGAVSAPHKIAWASFGNRVRFTGYADIGIPRNDAHIHARFEALERFAHNIYPAARRIVPSRWMGQRPMTPDGLPIIGASRHGNLYFNCGHGAMGWTMACGSARLLRDAMTGSESGIDSRAYRWSRFD